MTASGAENYTTVYDYNDADGDYTALLQKEIKTIEDETLQDPLLPGTDNTVQQTAYSYDGNGNQLTKTDYEGNIESYSYDSLNQLIGFIDNKTTANYAYNAAGQRVKKTVNGETIKHIWGGNQIAADVVDNEFYEANCYVRGTNLIAKYNFCNGAKSDYTYYLQNAHGDVVNLAGSDGIVIKTYKYDAFGVEKNISDTDNNPFRYCGEYYDKETGTIYLRARNYDASTGRFTSRDSFAGNAGDPLSLNLYTYCANNPILYFDPSGHFSLTGWFKNRCDDWKDGVDIMHSMGGGWSVAASYCEGVVDNGGAIINSAAHPIDTVSTAWSDFKADPLKNNLVTQTVTGIGGFYTGLWNASSNGDWNSVAYSLGGATTNVAAVGVTGKLGAKVAGKVAP